MKIFDCFTFYNEFELLELRLKMLNDRVDYFVLVEANSTFTGKQKGFLFDDNKEMYSSYLNKIIHIKVMDMPASDDPWDSEFHQRNCITRGLEKCDPDDLIVISDIDEIPSINAIDDLDRHRSAVKFCNHSCIKHNLKKIIQYPECLTQKFFGIELLEKTPLAFTQKLFRYFVNCKCKADWQGSVITKFKNLVSPQHIRDRRDYYPRMPDGGWHFSYLGGVDRVILKINSYSHTFANTERTNSFEYMQKCLENGVDFLGREDKRNALEFIDVGDLFPREIHELTQKYPELILQKRT